MNKIYLFAIASILVTASLMVGPLHLQQWLEVQRHQVVTQANNRHYSLKYNRQLVETQLVQRTQLHLIRF